MKKNILFVLLLVTMLSIALIGCRQENTNTAFEEIPETASEKMIEEQSMEPSLETLETIPEEASTEIPETILEEASTETPETVPEEASTETPETISEEASTETSETISKEDAIEHLEVVFTEAESTEASEDETQYLWKNDIKYFSATENTIYYAQKELNIYRHPNTSSEIIGTLSTDAEVKCIGSIFYGSGANYESYLVTESFGCIPTTFHQSTSRWDLRIARTYQVIARCGNNYTIYDNYDLALASICGSSWTTIKQTWTYNDYKSQGLPFMNSYSLFGANITVTTKDGNIPYNCIMNGVEYYFE